MKDYASKPYLQEQSAPKKTKTDGLGCIVKGACVGTLLAVMVGIASNVTVDTSVQRWKPYKVRKGDTYDKISENLRREYGGSEHLRHDIRDMMEKRNKIPDTGLREGITIYIPADAHEDKGYDIVLRQIKKLCGAD